MSLDKLNLPVTPTEAGSALDLSAIARLKKDANDQSPETLKKVAQQFESLFLEMMLKSMREAKLGEGIFDSDAGDLYQSMFDKQIATQLATGNGKGLGIAEMLVRQLSPKTPEQQTEPLGAITEGMQRLLQEWQSRSEAAKAAPAAGTASAVDKTTWRPSSPAEFVREILPFARKAAAALKVHPLGLVAQAAVETGWGKHMSSAADGASSMNVFGIKAGASWSGEKVSAGTLEFEDGLPVARQASFRRYASLEDSFNDYVSLLNGSSRYSEVRERGLDLNGFADALGRSGYATDPEYANKIKGVLNGDTLRDALRELKIEHTESII